MITEDYRVFEPDARISKLKGFFRETNAKAVVVQDGAYEGIVTQRQLISSHHDPDEKVGSVTTHPPTIGRHEGVREVARLMVEGNTKVVPVIEGEQLKGVVTADDLLAAISDQLDVLAVDDVYTEDLRSVGPETTVGEVIHVLREHGISRVPVVEDGRPVGIVTRYDLLGFSVREENKDDKGGGGSSGGDHGGPPGAHGGHGSRGGDSIRMLDIPARDVMNEPAATVEPSEPLDDAVEQMREMGYSSLVVTDGDRPVGILTKTDVLRALTWTEEEHMDVQITNIELLDMMAREDVVAMVEEIGDKYQDMQILHAHVHLQKHKESMRGEPLIQARVMLHTNKGQFVGTDEGFGTRHALRLARDTVERQVLSDKSVRQSDRDAQRLFKELGY